MANQKKTINLTIVKERRRRDETKGLPERVKERESGMRILDEVDALLYILPEGVVVSGRCLGELGYVSGASAMRRHA